MARRLRLALAALCLASSALAQGSDAAAPVRRLYTTYGVGSAAANAGFSDKDAAALFSKGLLALYRRAAKAGLDYDFFVQGQDFNLVKPVEITRSDVTGENASVAAMLTQADPDEKGRRKIRTDRFTFTIVREEGAWRIDDAAHGRETFRQVLKQTLESGGLR